MKVLFRVDASLQIGTGHLMRCLTLARILRQSGADCSFVCREHEGNLLARIRGEGIEAIGLPMETPPTLGASLEEPQLAHADWLAVAWQDDVRQTKSVLGEKVVDWLIVDHYALDYRWESAMRPHCGRIFVIDDLADREHDCDLLLDQNLVANLEHRYDALVPSQCVLLLGPTFAMLQPDYAELHCRAAPRLGPVRRILIYFGGVDQHNLTGLAIAAFFALKRNDIALDVVINPSSPHAGAVRTMVQGHVSITLHEVLPSLAPLMMRADFAVGAGGATSWERCCLGLPALVVTLAENQRPIAAAMHERGFVRWLGHCSSVSEPEVTQALNLVIDDDTLHGWSENCRKLVDGKGAERVASILLLDGDTPLKVRLACLQDENLLLSWANDPLVRRNSFHSAFIDAATHRRWFYDRLRDFQRCRIFIVETMSGLAIGQVRFERKADAWEIGFSLAPEARGKKLGKPLLLMAMEELRRSETATLIFGRVKDGNYQSKAVFEELNFSGEKKEGQFVYRRAL